MDDVSRIFCEVCQTPIQFGDKAVRTYVVPETDEVVESGFFHFRHLPESLPDLGKSREDR